MLKSLVELLEMDVCCKFENAVLINMFSKKKINKRQTHVFIFSTIGGFYGPWNGMEHVGELDHYSLERHAFSVCKTIYFFFLIHMI